MEELECAWCGRIFPRPHMKGPRPKFCSASHRQRAHEAREREQIQRSVRSYQSLMTQVAGSGFLRSSQTFARQVAGSAALASYQTLAEQVAGSTTYQSLAKQLTGSGLFDAYESLTKQVADIPLLAQTEALALRVVDQAATGELDEDVTDVLQFVERGLAGEDDPAAVLLVGVLALVMWRNEEIFAAALAVGADTAETTGMLLAALQLLVNRHPTIGGLLIVLGLASLPRRARPGGVDKE